MNRRSKASLIIGAIVLLVTVITSLLCVDDWTEMMQTGVMGWAFVTLLWAEAAFFGGLVFVEWYSRRSEQIITRSALYVIIPSYAVIEFVVSVLYMTLLKEASGSFVIVQIALLVVTVIVMVVFLSASKGVHAANESAMSAAANIDAMVERLNKLAFDPECERFASTIKKLRDDLRFTDTSKVAVEDAEIADVISAIEVELTGRDDSANEKIKAALVRLNTLISQRKISVTAMNKGRI